MATHSRILPWKITWIEEPGGPWGNKKSGMTEWLRTYTHIRQQLPLQPGPAHTDTGLGPEPQTQRGAECRDARDHQPCPAWVTRHPPSLQPRGVELCSGCPVCWFQSGMTLSDPMDCSLPGFLVHGILQARILELISTSANWCSTSLLKFHTACWKRAFFFLWYFIWLRAGSSHLFL